MKKFLLLNICLSQGTEPKFGTGRLCFVEEKPKEGGGGEPKKKVVLLSEIGAETSDEESGEALQKAKANREERKEVVGETKDELASLRASLGPLPGSPEAEKKKKEDEAKKKKDEEEKKKKEDEKKGKEKKPGVPERAPDAMTGSQFAQAFDRCKNDEERQKLVLDQAAKGAFNPDSLTPKYYETVVDGKKVRVKMLNNIEFGVPGDSVRVATDGQTSQAIADMLGGALPTADFYRMVYNDPSVQKMPFFYGGTLEAEWRRRGEHPSTFHVTDSRGRTYPSGRVMQSGEYMAMHSQMQDEWLDSNGVDRKRFMVGGRKTVFAPDVPGAPDGKIVFGGGLYGVPYQVQDPNNPEKTKTAYRVDDTPGKYVQGIGDHAHEPTWHDYAAGTDIVLSVEVEGKEVPVNQFMTDEKYEGTRKALFGAGSSVENRYNLPPWMKGYVEDYRKSHEGQELPGAEEKKPAPVFEGIPQQAIEKGKVSEEFDYTVAQGAPGGHVRFVKTDAGDVAVLDWQGKEYQVKVDLNNSSGIGKSKEGYGASGSEIAGPFAYIMLRYFREHGHKVGDVVPFEYNGQQYIAEYQIHNDGPTGPIPYDHPGVGIMMKKTTDQFSQIPSGPGMPHGPGPSPKPQKPADVVEPPPQVGGAAPRARVATGGGGGPSYGGGAGPSYGGGAPSYAPSGYVAPSYSPPAYVPPVKMESHQAKTEVGSQKPVEGVEGPPKVPYTSLGDSITVGVDAQSRGSFVKLGYHTRRNEQNPANPEMVGKTTSYMKTHLSREVLPSIESTGLKVIVLGGGGNDILGPLPTDEAMERTKKSVTDNLSQMYRSSHDAGLKVVAMTMPPFDRFIESRFPNPEEKARHYRLWKEVNDYIMENEGKPGGPDKVVKTHEIVGTQVGDNWLLQENYSSSKDLLHPTPKAYGAIAREVEKAVNALSGETKKPEAPGPQEGQKPEGEAPPEEAPGILSGFEKSPYFNEKIKTYNYPEGDPDPLRVHVNAPGNFDHKKPTRVVVFALPAGNTIEQTIGTTKKDGQDWHFEIQQIAAQTRKLRESSPGENIVVAYVEAPRLNPGAWHKDQVGRGEIIGQLANDIKSKIGAPNATIDFSSHSAGRSLVNSYLDETPQIPVDVKRISYLDSNHGFNPARGDKMVSWLNAAPDHYLTVISYDDQNIVDKSTGEPIKGRVGYARTYEMIDHFQKQGLTLTKEQKNGYVHFTGLNGRVNILIMDNPGNTILHTETVSRNGFIYSQTAGTGLDGTAGRFNTRGYEQFIQPESPKLEITA